MAFDRLDTNTIVTLHSSGSRSLARGRSDGGTLQTSAKGVSKTCKTDTRPDLGIFMCGTSGFSQGGGTRDPGLLWGEHRVSASCGNVKLSGFECPYRRGRWTAPEKVICTILETNSWADGWVISARACVFLWLVETAQNQHQTFIAMSGPRNHNAGIIFDFHILVFSSISEYKPTYKTAELVCTPGPSAPVLLHACSSGTYQHLCLRELSSRFHSCDAHLRTGWVFQSVSLCV